jgi:hypothetical protein
VRLIRLLAAAVGALPPHPSPLYRIYEHPSRGAMLVAFDQMSSLASVGKVMFLGCTVVSTMTRERSAGFIARSPSQPPSFSVTALAAVPRPSACARRLSRSATSRLCRARGRPRGRAWRAAVGDQDQHRNQSSTARTHRPAAVILTRIPGRRNGPATSVVVTANPRVAVRRPCVAWIVIIAVDAVSEA